MYMFSPSFFEQLNLRQLMLKWQHPVTVKFILTIFDLVSIIIVLRNCLENYNMRMLFDIDTKDYDMNGSVFIRPSARGIIIKGGNVAMIHSLKYDYYKFPGGGIESDEHKEDALVREVLEETGLRVIRSSIHEYGQVHRIQKGDKEDVFIQDNYYFLCAVETEVKPQRLDDYESWECFTLEYVNPQEAINTNRRNRLEETDHIMLERDAMVLEFLIKEGYFENV